MVLKNVSVLRNALLALLATLGMNAFGQSKNNPDPNMIPSGMMKVAPLGRIVLTECVDDWDVMLKTTEKAAPAPGSDLAYEERKRWKAEANAARDRAMALEAGTSNKVAAGPAPVQGTHFVGNTRNGFDPADNGLAVGLDGTTISVINARIDVYDSTGTNLFSTSLDAFDSNLPSISSFTFDPRVTYDPAENRWVLIYLTGLQPTNTNVIVGFSETANPLNGWNVYAINGNPFNDGTFTDYPSIGLSSEELFITGNSFSGPTSFESGIMWQIDKFDGYNGDPLDLQAYTNPYSTLKPVEGGATLYGPEFYLVRVSSTTQTGNTFTLHEVTNSLANGGVVNAPLTFSVAISYTFPADAVQPGNAVDLRISDFRTQDAYFENNQIHLVFNSTSAGIPSIYYCVGTLSPFLLSFSSFDGFPISFPTYHLGYPAIAYAGETDINGRNKSFISFNYTGPTHNPGHAAAYIDESGVSDILILKSSSGTMNPADRRWGDYTDINERPGKPGEVWANGTYANFFQQQTYISQLLPPVPVALEEEEVAGLEMEIYPNPTTDRVNFRFRVEEAGNYRLVIRDMEGREIKAFEDYGLWLGMAQLEFNTTALPSGIYSVSVESVDKVLFSEKLAVQK